MNPFSNLGVIISQNFQGLANSFNKLESNIEINDFILGFSNSSIFSYKSISNPFEGIILIVIHVVSEKLKESKVKLKTIEGLFDFICLHENKTLAITSNYLP